MTATRMPLDLRPGDRVLLRQHGRVTTLTLATRAQVCEGGSLYLRFTDGSGVTVDDLSVPIEVAS